MITQSLGPDLPPDESLDNIDMFSDTTSMYSQFTRYTQATSRISTVSSVSSTGSRYVKFTCTANILLILCYFWSEKLQSCVVRNNGNESVAKRALSLKKSTLLIPSSVCTSGQAICKVRKLFFCIWSYIVVVTSFHYSRCSWTAFCYGAFRICRRSKGDSDEVWWIFGISWIRCGYHICTIKDCRRSGKQATFQITILRAL